MNKTWNWTLTILAVVNCALLVALVSYFDSLTQGMAIMGAILIPLYVVLFSIIVIILLIVKRKDWFVKPVLFSTISMMLFCTPIPLLFFWNLSQPTITTSEEGGWLNENTSYKTEEDKQNGKIIATRHWFLYEGEHDYVKDSIWAYLDENGDTSRIEVYKKGELKEGKDY